MKRNRKYVYGYKFFPGEKFMKDWHQTTRVFTRAHRGITSDFRLCSLLQNDQH